MGSGSSLNTFNSSESCLSISSNIFANLPDDLLQELLLYLSPIEVNEFSRANNDLTNRLKKRKSRLYFLYSSKKTMSRDFLSSPFVMRLGEGSPSTFNLNFYYYQRKLGPFFTPFPFARFDIVQCSTGHLPLLVRNKADFIQDLQIAFDKPVNYELNKDLEPLAEALKVSTLVVNKMTLWRTERFALPVFHGVVSLTINDCKHQTSEEMNIHQNSRLRHLKLASCGVRDVTKFSHIYDLQLHNCHAITDISCLNDNHKITISNCSGIRDYSNAFKHCYEITIYCRETHRHEQSIDVYTLVNVKKLLLSNLPFLVDERPLPSSLSSLSIFSCPVLSRLPENNLRTVKISCCKNFMSLENMTNIKNVELTELNIESLDGLGVANRSITISDCRKIRDWKAVRENEFVCFENSSFRTLFYRRRMRVTAGDGDEGERDILDPTYMKAITHLSTNLLFPMNFTNAKKLREIIVDLSGTSRWIIECWRLLEAVMPLPRVEKVVLKPLNITSEIQSDTRFPILLSRYGFTVHYSNKSLVLLRKGNDRNSHRWKIPWQMLLKKC